MSGTSFVRVASLSLLTLFAAATFCSLSGCEAASAGGEAIGSAFDALDAALRAGKAERFSNVPVDQAIAATKSASDDLGLKFVRVAVHPDQQKITYKDDRGQEIVCTLIRRTAKTTEVRVDVSLVGPNNFSRLMLDRILSHLGAPGNSANRPGATPAPNEQ
jgi:hypothetical protein